MMGERQKIPFKMKATKTAQNWTLKLYQKDQKKPHTNHKKRKRNKEKLHISEKHDNIR